MEQLGDDEILSIFNKISNPDDKKSFSQVSKQFLKVSCIRLYELRNSFPPFLTDIFPASPNLGNFRCPKSLSNTHMKLLAQSCPKLWYLHLGQKDADSDSYESSFDFDDDGLCAVANACIRLYAVKLNMRLHVGNVGVISLVRLCKNLTHLDLEKCVKVTDESLKAIGESTCLDYLGLRGCCLITDLGLEYLLNGGLNTCLEKLNLAECDKITDTGIVCLKQMVSLTDLNLSKCGDNITDVGITALASQIPEIEILDLSWLKNVTDLSMCDIGSECLKLTSVSLRGCKAITRETISSFAGHETLRDIELYLCDIDWEDVEFLAATCISLEYIGLSRSINSPTTSSYFSFEENDCVIGWE